MGLGTVELTSAVAILLGDANTAMLRMMRVPKKMEWTQVFPIMLRATDRATPSTMVLNMAGHDQVITRPVELNDNMISRRMTAH